MPDDQRDIVGVLAMTDIASEKVVRFMQGHGLTRNEVTVADMMTPARELQAVSLAQV